MKAKQTGFTLIELMFVVILAGILLGIGIPNYRQFIQNSRMAQFSNDLIADINLARSEALKRRLPVTICASANSAASSPTCADGGSFAQWIVFVDTNGDGVAGDNAEETNGDGALDTPVLLRRGSGVTSITPTSSSGDDRLTYLASGFASPDADRLQFIRLCDSRRNTVSVGGVSAARLIDIGPTGRPSVRREVSTITSVAGDCP